jgi:hypothetical protein
LKKNPHNGAFQDYYITLSGSILLVGRHLNYYIDFKKKKIEPLGGFS